MGWLTRSFLGTNAEFISLLQREYAQKAQEQDDYEIVGFASNSKILLSFIQFKDGSKSIEVTETKQFYMEFGRKVTCIHDDYVDNLPLNEEWIEWFLTDNPLLVDEGSFETRTALRNIEKHRSNKARQKAHRALVKLLKAENERCMATGEKSTVQFKVTNRAVESYQGMIVTYIPTRKLDLRKGIMVKTSNNQNLIVKNMKLLELVN